jgi:glutamyl-tRNA synthetase
VIRAEEWISSTQKHVLLYRAFGWEEPEFIHMPLLRNKDKSKISKRKNPVSINYYRDVGILPNALLNFLGTLGWSFGNDREKFTLPEMVDVFSWDRISLGGPTFDLDKLTWLNEQYIHELSYEDFAQSLIDWRLNKDYLTKVLPLVRERVKKLSDVIPATEYFFSGDLDYTAALPDMAIPDVTSAAIGKALLDFVERFEAKDGFTKEMLEAVAREWAQAHGWKSGQAFMLLRLAITGRKASPPLFETMAVLGKELSRRRLRRAAEVVASGGKLKQ